MNRASRSRLAKAYVSLIGKHPITRLNIVLAHFVIQNKMLNEVDLLINDINKELALQKGIMSARVISAFELSDQIKKHLKTLIAKETGAKEVRLESRIDKSVLGGLIAYTPEKEFDFTLATKLQELRV